ncbi:acyl carrier protein phosphodiesterase [Photobacterium gaetbulicola]|uniref:Acyl carrier protein phosphodiesterase n=1 Tax=Photobacterium gaetbulicola TaxID=1295392 RepID=A0A0B9GJQ5_9GAMM|nr:ACP phosphodiesterase [Photobacterium gaetbulicola]KHT59176.1 acyl carrier protein phosphodiesterase [Photobacterium gaetbulicola]
MNFLAHLHLAQQCNSHLAGNLLADFVRGDPYRQFDRDIADGIKLHRFVDSYIDAMPEVRQCRQLFGPTTRRVSGIALDMAWDHFLARHWQQFHPQTLPDFVTAARAEVEKYQHNMPESYLLTMSRMWQQNWLLQYRYPETLNTALLRMAERRPRLHQLALTPEVLMANYRQLEEAFFLIYPQVEQAAQQFQPYRSL